MARLLRASRMDAAESFVPKLVQAADTRGQATGNEAPEDAGAREVVEWVDHSRASPLEEFNADVEELLARWGLGEALGVMRRRGSWSSEAGSEEGAHGWRTAELALGKDVYAFSLLSASDSGARAARLAGGADKSRLSPTELALLHCAEGVRAGDGERDGAEDGDGAWGIGELPRWFGMQDFLVMGPTEREPSLNDVSLLLSSSALAMAGCSPALPCVVWAADAAQHDPRSALAAIVRPRAPQGALFGVCVAGAGEPPGAVTHFNALRRPRQQVASKLHYLSGLAHLFRCKLWPETGGRPPPAVALQGGQGGGGGGGFQAAAAAAGEPLLASGEVVASVRFTFLNRRVSLGSPVLRDAGPRASELAAQWSEFHDLDLAWRLFVEEGEAAQPDEAGHSESNAERETARALAHLRGGSGRPPLWGPLQDPVRGFDLAVAWPSFTEGALTENASFSSLDPRSAPRWLLRARVVAFEEGLSLPTEAEDEADKASRARAPLARRRALPDGPPGAASGAGADLAHDEDAEEAVCPLARSVGFLLDLLGAAAQGQLRGSMLSTVSASLRTASVGRRDARDVERERRRIAEVVAEVFSNNAAEPDAVASSNVVSGHGVGGSDSRDEPMRAASAACWVCAKGSLTVPSSKLAKPQQPQLQQPQQQQQQQQEQLRKARKAGSLLAAFALRVGEFGASIEAFSALWRAFTAELRWHWDHLVPLSNVGVVDGLSPVDPKDCLLQQKLVLFNLCIAAEAHRRFGHSAEDDVASSAKQQTSQRQRHDQKEHAQEDEDEFFDARGAPEAGQPAGRSVTPPPPPPPPPALAPASAVPTSWVEPWTVEAHLMTADMRREREELLSSLALSAGSAPVHERMLREALVSDMAAFKAANPRAGFEAFCTWKAPVRRLGEFWRGEWQACQAAPLQSQLPSLSSGLFSAAQAAERLLHSLETISPEEALLQLFHVALESAELVFAQALKRVAAVGAHEPGGDGGLSADLDSQLAALRAQINSLDLAAAVAQAATHPPRDDAPGAAAAGAAGAGTGAGEAAVQAARRRAAVEHLERLEFHLSLGTSLLHKLPACAAAAALRAATTLSSAEHETGEAELRSGGEREHVWSLLFGERTRAAATVAPDLKEYLLRCVARRSSFAQPAPGAEDTAPLSADGAAAASAAACVRPGANRLFARVARDSVTLATALTETAF